MQALFWVPNHSLSSLPHSRFRGLADIRRRQGALHDAAQPVAPGSRQPGGRRKDEVYPEAFLSTCIIGSYVSSGRIYDLPLAKGDKPQHENLSQPLFSTEQGPLHVRRIRRLRQRRRRRGPRGRLRLRPGSFVSLQLQWNLIANIMAHCKIK